MNTAPPRILVVDDNPFNREMLKEFLKAEDCAVTEGRNGKEALKHVGESVFSIIFMDLLMPGMDGFETIRKIRRMGVATPIIIVSAMTSREDRQRCLEAGGDDFLPKPVTVGAIHELMEKFRRGDFSKPDNHDPEREREKDEDGQCLIDFGKCNVLLVEEEDALAGRYGHFLKTAGFNVTRVNNGDQAWELFAGNKRGQDIIISNVFTSGTDGLGLLAKIRQEYAGILFFIYAGIDDAEMFQLAIQLGADGVVTLDKFESVIIDLIESAMFRSGTGGARTRAASTASQVRKAQEKLIRVGCEGPCDAIDIAYSQLSDAGGDLACCRCFEPSGNCGILIGDVSGHNVLSSYVSAISLGIVSSNWDGHQDPMDLIKTINTELNKSGHENYHLCASALLWDKTGKRIKIASAGNPGALLVSENADGSISVDQRVGGGMCLGLIDDDSLFDRDEFKFQGGDHLFLFSDGIEKDHLIDILKSESDILKKTTIRGVSTLILEELLEKHGQQDDMILITLRHPKNIRSGELRYWFPSTYSAVDKAFEWAEKNDVREIIPKGNDPDFVMLAMREALINAVKHGNGFDPESGVELVLRFAPGELGMDISDQGPGFELPKDIPKIGDLEILQTGGRGLAIMYSVSDELRSENGTLSLVFREKHPDGEPDK